MNQLLFAAWVVAGAALILPLGMFVRLGRRLGGLRRAGRLSAVSAGAASTQGETVAFPHTAGTEFEELSPLQAEAFDNPAGLPSRIPLSRVAPVLNLLLYVVFIVGAVYYIPQILSWALDTPHPLAAVSSQSMWPTLRKGDLIFLKGVDEPEDLQIGDIIAFRHQKGITVHRVLEIDGDVITTQGDANTVPDKPVEFDQVIGRVVTIGGRLAKVPQVGSIAGLFGPLATQADQPPDEQLSMEESGAVSPAVDAQDPRAEQAPAAGQADASLGTTEAVSMDSAGNLANGTSTSPAISADGRFIAFVSAASNLVPGDTNGESDIFVHDRQTGATNRVSVDGTGSQADGSSGEPTISADGRFVAFMSAAANLVPGDANGEGDIIVHDRRTGATQRVSVDSGGGQANGSSGSPSISANGRFVAFVSAASGLVPGDTNGESDVFVHDRQTGTTERVSVDSAGDQGNGGSASPSISADGRYVAFTSAANNFAPGDAGGGSDVFVRDREIAVTERVSGNSAGNAADGSSEAPAISADGRFVAFQSKATNLVPRDFNRDQDIFVHDRQTGVTERVSVDSKGSQGDSGSSEPAISSDGRFVAFASAARRLVPGDTNRRQDAFVHDRGTGSTERVSVDNTGSQGNDYSGLPAISADGRFITFWSLSGNLVPGETQVQRVFVRDRMPVALGGETQ